MANRLTQRRLLELYDYSPSTGIFTHKRGGTLRKPGERAGFVDPRGFITIRVDGVAYYAHRLAWLAYYGKWPELQVDHINRKKADNRITNLREATDSQQRMNSVKAWGMTGIRGVTIRPRRKRFYAQIKLHGKNMSLGYHRTIEEAERAYESARRRLFGEFCPT